MLNYTTVESLKKELGLTTNGRLSSNRVTYAEMTDVYAKAYHEASLLVHNTELRLLRGEDIAEEDKAKIREAADIVYRDGYTGQKYK